MVRYEVRYQKPSATGTMVTHVNASSASQAKEQIKARFNGQVKIVSVVAK